MRVLRSCVAVICTVAFSVGVQANSDARKVLSPSSSGDDTAQLQAALSKCTNAKRPCDLRLTPGVFHTDVLLAKGFHGSITGSGQARTIIRPLANQALRSTRQPFIAEPTLAEPYPALLYFDDGGKISISRLTLEFPASMRVASWNFYLSEEQDIQDSLVAAIFVASAGQAELQMSNVKIIANDKNERYFGSNIFTGVRFEGEIRFSGDADVTRKLKRGRLVAHDNTLLRTGDGFSVEDAENTTALVYRNEFDSRVYSIIFTNLSASNAAAYRNIIRTEIEGIFVAQTPERPPAKRSNYLLSQNIINVNEDDTSIDPDGVGYDGIGVFDFAPAPETILANVTIWDNDVTVRDGEVLAGFSIYGDGRGSMQIFGNRLYGIPSDAGVYVDASRGTAVFRNDLGALGDIPGVWLAADSRDCRVIEPNDIVRDEGQGNHVIGAPGSTGPASASSSTATSSALTSSAAPLSRRAARRLGF
jgi:hypothetical protein